MSRINRRKHIRNLMWTPEQNIVTPAQPTELGTAYVAVSLTDPDEQDRAVVANISVNDATYLAHRILHAVAAIEAAEVTAREKAAAKAARIAELAAGDGAW